MKRALLRTTALIAPVLAGIGFPCEASAQETAVSGSRVEEIVVMARRVRENLQAVPVAVTALSSAELQNHSVKTLYDVQHLTPGFSIQQKSTVGAFNAQTQMRGIINTVVSVAVGLPVAVYHDGVYSASLFGIIADGFYDVERVEVLKGPQGTLFGQNTTAGAIAIYHKQPVDNFEGEAGLGYGKFNEFKAKGMVNIPIVKGKVALRVSGTYTDDDGYGWNTYSNYTLGDIKLWNMRAAMKFTPSDKLTVTFEGHAVNGSSNGQPTKTTYFVPGSGYNLTAAVALFGPTALAPANAGTTVPAAAKALQNLIDNGGIYNWNLNLYPKLGPGLAQQAERYVKKGGQLTVDYDLGFAHLKSYSGFDKFERFTLYGLGDIGQNFTGLQYIQGAQLSEDLQLSGKLFNDRLSYTLGAYYYDLEANDDQVSAALPAINPATPTTQLAKVGIKNYAVFSQVTYAVTPTVNVTAGGRWTKVNKEIQPVSIAPTGCQIPLDRRVNGACISDARTTEAKVSWTAGVDWTPIEDKMVYVKVSRGFTAGGPPLRVTANPNSYANYEPEELTQYEIGSKSDFLDHRLRANAAAYYTKYSNLQKAINLGFPAPGGGTTFTNVYTNAAAASIRGAEFELKAVPFENADLLFTAAYTEPKYTSYFDRGFDVSSQRFLLVSKWTYTVGGGYTIPTGIGKLMGQMTWAWRSSNDLYPPDTPGTVAGAARGPGLPDQYRIQQGYGLLNGTVMLNIEEYDADIRFYATNILDKRYFTGGVSLVNAGLGFNAFNPGEPRRWGFEVLKRF